MVSFSGEAPKFKIPMKAIVYASVRSGSTLLCKALDSHPNITAREEIITTLVEERGEEVMRDGELHLQELKEGFENGADIFKFMYTHITPETWNYFLENDVKIIHLIRENTARQALSAMRAKITGEWSTLQKKEKKAVYIKPEKLEWWIRYIEKKRKEAFERLEDVDCLNVTYCDLVGFEGNEIVTIPQKVSDKVLGYLGRSKRQLSVPIKKQGSKDLKEIVENPEEIEDIIARYDKLKEDGR